MTPGKSECHTQFNFRKCFTAGMKPSRKKREQLLLSIDRPTPSLFISCLQELLHSKWIKKRVKQKGLVRI